MIQNILYTSWISTISWPMPPDREERFLGEHDSVRRSPRTVNAFNYFQNLDFLSKTLELYDFSKLDRGLKFHRDVWGYFRTISFHPDQWFRGAGIFPSQDTKMCEILF